MFESEKLIIGLIILILIGLSFLGYNQIKERQKFLVENNCVLIEQQASKTHMAFGINSNGTTTTMPIIESGSKTYKCKDGIIYKF